MALGVNPGVSFVDPLCANMLAIRVAGTERTPIPECESPPTPQSFTHGVFWNVVVEGVEAGIWRPLSQFSPQWVGEGVGQCKSLVS